MQEEPVDEPATDLAAEIETGIEAETILSTGTARSARGHTECAALTEVPHYAALMSGKLNLRVTANEILHRLAVIFGAEPNTQMSVSVKFSIGNEAAP